MPGAESDGKSEIWFHEDCFIWVPCTALVGGRLVGMEEAVAQTRGLDCAVCACAGASVGCTEHGCRNAAHLACATEAAWDLDMDNFRVRCAKCKVKRGHCLLYTSPSPRDGLLSRMPSSA